MSESGHAAEEVIDLARAYVDANGPVAVDAVMAHLDARGLSIDRDDLIDELVDGRGIWWLGDRLLRASQVLPGRSMTRRLTEEEIEGDFVAVEPDLHLLTLDESPSFETAAGALVEHFVSDAQQLRGPVGWLSAFAADDVVAVRWLAPASLEVTAADLTDGALEAHALRAAFEAIRRDGLATLLEALVRACQSHPAAFQSAAPPLSDLLPRAGLSVRGDELADEAFDWEALFRQRREDYASDLATAYDLGLEQAARLATLALAAVWDDPVDHDVDLQACADGLRDPAVTAAFLESAVRRMAEDVERLRRFASTISAAGGSHPPAGALLALARAAELEGDVLAHASLVEETLRADPQFWAALEDRAWIRSDRGDARGAAADLERVADDADPQLLVLDRFTARGPTSTGRNERCPCGSGAKHKACCGRTNGYRLVDRAPWLYEKAMWFASRPAQRAGLEELIEAAVAGDDGDLPVDVLAEDPVVHALALFGAGLITRFCDERAALLPADEAELVRGWVGSPSRLLRIDRIFSLDEVSVTDLVSGEELVAALHAADDTLSPGCVVIAPLLSDGDRPSLLGWAPVIEGVVDRIREGMARSGVLGVLDVYLRSRWKAAKEFLDRIGATSDERLEWLFAGADVDLRAERSIEELVRDQHPDLATAMARGQKTVRVEDGHEIDPVLHVALHEVVANQILQDEPPEVWLTALRLSAHGYERHEVLHMLASAISDQLHAARHDARPYDADEHLAALDALPDTWEAARLVHRVDRGHATRHRRRPRR